MKKIYIEITNTCNLNCAFCLNTNREKAFMNVKNFEEVVLKIKNFTNLVCLHVKGEPLLHPQLMDILWILDKYNLKTNITTNGTLLNEKIDIIKNSSSVRQLNLSLHSSIENDNLNVKKYLEDVYKNIQKLKNTNIIISYRMWNLNKLSNNEKNKIIIEFLSEKYSLPNLDELLKQNEWVKLEDKIFINQDIKFTWPNLKSKILNENGRCLAIKDQIGILVNGDIIPCCIDSEGKIVLGNIFKQELEDVLNSSKAINMKNGFQKNILVEDLCKRCGFLQRLKNKRN